MAKKGTKKNGRGGARPGSGRPPSDDPPVVVGGRVPTSLVVKFDRWARANGLNRSQAVTEAIRRLVDAAGGK